MALVDIVKKNTFGNGLKENSSKVVTTDKATNADIAKKSDEYKPIVPSTLEYAVKAGLVDNKQVLTEYEKNSIADWIDVPRTYLVPTKVSELKNDSGFALRAELDEFKKYVNDLFQSEKEEETEDTNVCITFNDLNSAKKELDLKIEDLKEEVVANEKIVASAFWNICNTLGTNEYAKFDFPKESSLSSYNTVVDALLSLEERIKRLEKVNNIDGVVKI